MASFADLAAPSPLQRFIDHQVDAGFRWHKGLDDEQEQLAADRQRRPAGSIEHLMKEAPIGSCVIATGTQRCRDGAASVS
jgi:hypothetical protein